MISFVCQSCGFESKKWCGKCPNCNNWNTMAEQEVHSSSKAPGSKGYSFAHKLPDIELLSSATASSAELSRIPTKIAEFDNAIGGGFVAGSAILIGGEPGIGKSTLLLQLAQFVSKSGKKVLYVSGEESTAQINSRAFRMGLAGDSSDSISVVSSGSISALFSILSGNSFDFLFIDSVQTMFVHFIENSPGTINQIRAVTTELIGLCKPRNMVLVLIGHITKDGAIAGPKLLEHLVDCVMYFEGESRSDFRILRTTKNRFGPTNEIGVFEMRSTGLAEVANPSAFFVQNSDHASREILFVALEGTRCVLVPVESLIAKSYTVSPRRSVVGWDGGRLSMILAAVQTHCGGFAFHDKDVYLSMAGGFKTNESGNDLAVVASLMLAYNRINLTENIVVIGEITLKGAARQVSSVSSRVKEAKKLGYRNFILPSSDNSSAISANEPDLNIIQVCGLHDLRVAIDRFAKKA